jgi:hypothetical protein
MSKANKKLEAQLETLATLPRPKLLAEFRDVYRKDPPLRLSNHIMALAVAYRLQEQAYGGLKPEIRRLLLSGTVAAPVRPTSPGTVLIREWHGTQHTVTVFPDKVGYRGELYGSLTEVATLITGHKRSGPRFFGLRRPEDE